MYMTMRTRKFLGIIFCVAFMIFYALLAMTIAVAKLQDAAHIWQLLYFLVVGIGWAIPLMPIIRWMQRPDTQ